MTRAQEKFEALAHELVLTESLQRKLTFGAPSLLANGYSFLVFDSDHAEVVFRLTGEAGQRALALAGAHLFTPMGQPMGNWVCLPLAHAHQWRDWALQALAQVRALPPKKPRTPKAKKIK